MRIFFTILLIIAFGKASAQQPAVSVQWQDSTAMRLAFTLADGDSVGGDYAVRAVPVLTNGGDTLRKAARTLLLVAGFAVLGVLLGEWMVASEKEERRRQDMEQAERNRAMQRLQDSLDREAARRREMIKEYKLTPEQRRAMDELVRRQADDRRRAEELVDKYNRGEELSPAEKDFVYDQLWQEYYEDPDDEGHYPSEIFDDREDYDEEHVRDNPGVAGED